MLLNVSAVEVIGGCLCGGMLQKVFLFHLKYPVIDHKNPKDEQRMNFSWLVSSDIRLGKPFRLIDFRAHVFVVCEHNENPMNIIIGQVWHATPDVYFGQRSIRPQVGWHVYWSIQNDRDPWGAAWCRLVGGRRGPLSSRLPHGQASLARSPPGAAVNWFEAGSNSHWSLPSSCVFPRTKYVSLLRFKNVNLALGRQLEIDWLCEYFLARVQAVPRNQVDVITIPLDKSIGGRGGNPF